MDRNHSNSTAHPKDIRRAPMYPLYVATTEAVPIEFVNANLPNQSNNKEAPSGFEVPIQKNSQVGMMPTMVEPARQSSKLAVGQTSGAMKVDEKVEPKSEKVPTPKTSGGPGNGPGKDQSREAKEKGVDINDRVSKYISRAKMRIRSMSIAGGTKGAGHKDSGTDSFGNFIQRARLKVRMMSGIGGDNNVRSK